MMIIIFVNYLTNLIDMIIIIKKIQITYHSMKFRSSIQILKNQNFESMHKWDIFDKTQ